MARRRHPDPHLLAAVAFAVAAAILYAIAAAGPPSTEVAATIAPPRVGEDLPVAAVPLR